VLRPGRAGSNNAADHLAVLDSALAQLPITPADTDIVVRTDSAGATHDFVEGCVERGVGFLVGLPVDAAVRDAFMLVQEEDWVPAIEADGTCRDGAWLVELGDLIDHHWGEGVRLIARRERPHPGAQLTLFDTAEGFRHQVFITDQTDADIAALELRHRHRAHVENRIRAAKDCGLRNLPCEDFVRNEAWLQLVLIAQDLHAWAQTLCFDGELAIAEPKKLRHRVWHAAAVIAHTGRQTIVRFQGRGHGRPTSSSPSNASASPCRPDRHRGLDGITINSARPNSTPPDDPASPSPPITDVACTGAPINGSPIRSGPTDPAHRGLPKGPG
jgi:hypothetical protein